MLTADLTLTGTTAARAAPEDDGYYLWSPHDPTLEVGARPVEIYRGDLYAVDTKTPCNKAWCIDNGSFTPVLVMTQERVAALDRLVDLAQFDLDEGYRRDQELRDAVEVVREMLADTFTTVPLEGFSASLDHAPDPAQSPIPP